MKQEESIEIVRLAYGTKLNPFGNIYSFSLKRNIDRFYFFMKQQEHELLHFIAHLNILCYMLFWVTYRNQNNEKLNTKINNYLFTVNAEDQIFPQKIYFLQMLYIFWKKSYMTEII